MKCSASKGRLLKPTLWLASLVLLTAVLVSTDEDLVPDFAIDRRIFQSPRFQDSYRFAFMLKHYGSRGGPVYYLLLFERKENT